MGTWHLWDLQAPNVVGGVQDLLTLMLSLLYVMGFLRPSTSCVGSAFRQCLAMQLLPICVSLLWLFQAGGQRVFVSASHYVLGKGV